MLKLNYKSKIYVMCHAVLQTGGPESLHNLTHLLRNSGYDAKMIYVPSILDPTPEDYKSYNIEHVDSVEDIENNLLIIPEIWTHKLRLYCRIQKAIWWLSVDYYFKESENFDFHSPANQEVIHLAKGKYVEEFLTHMGAKYICSLNSPINKSHFRKLKRCRRENNVLYNPNKESKFTRALIEKYPSINWVPITNMSRAKVINIMRKSKLYIDFGPFPGVERMPREAVINGCCIIVGIRGSASFYQDLPISNDYKFSVEPFDICKIYSKIQDCLDNYDKRLKDFENFKRLIVLENEKFKWEVKWIFGAKKKLLLEIIFVIKLIGKNIIKYVKRITYQNCKKVIKKLRKLILAEYKYIINEN